MSSSWLRLSGLLIAVTAVRADWRITTVRTDVEGRDSVVTEYYKGKQLRTDSQHIPGHPLVSVEDVDGLQFTQWLPREKEYAIWLSRSQPKEGATSATARAPVSTYLIESATTDTGEREARFGRTARHLITSEKRSVRESPGAEWKPEVETVTDGWYVDAAGLPQSRVPDTTFLLSFNGSRPVVKVTHTGGRLSGLAVQERVTFATSKSSRHTLETSMEVTELYEGVLPGSLFQPPPGFRHVAQLPDVFFVQPSFSDEVYMYWTAFERWFLSWFF